MTYFVALLCTIGIAAGQLLFKLSAINLRQTNNSFFSSGTVILLIALLLYGMTTLAWIWVLQRVELGHIYPLMALAFVFVPAGSYFLFGERFNFHYISGIILIILGIILTVKK